MLCPSPALVAARVALFLSLRLPAVPVGRSFRRGARTRQNRLGARTGSAVFVAAAPDDAPLTAAPVHEAAVPVRSRATPTERQSP
ncbi:hypothetical protein [Streptomyces sp. NPDC002769]|uniref:hypothetical protein n=1 Tax=Streptomyces sp. NPDC002769 TaxID=3154542 RepID=UPI0033227986